MNRTQKGCYICFLYLKLFLLQEAILLTEAGLVQRQIYRRVQVESLEVIHSVVLIQNTVCVLDKVLNAMPGGGWGC